MPTVDLPFKTRSLKHSFKRSKTDWIKQEVLGLFQPRYRTYPLFSAQKAATPSTLSFAGRIAKPLRGGGGGVVPNSTIQTPAGPPVSVNPLSRVQNEDGYVNLFCTVVSNLAEIFHFQGR
jgi:hypothetical protein